MRTKTIPAQFGFKALVQGSCGSTGTWAAAWQLTDGYFLSTEEVQKAYPATPVLWPVEELDNGAVCIPDPEEWQ